MAYEQISHVLPCFSFEGTFESAKELTSGNINHTYRVSFRLADGSLKEYVLQRINTYVFKKPDEVMSNVQKVTAHLKKTIEDRGGDASRRALHLIETVDGGCMVKDGENFWRAYDFITDAVAYDRVEKPEHFHEAGRAFGEFQNALASFPAAELYDTIPDFHNTKKRFFTFVQAVAEDKAGRVKELEEEVDFFFDRRKMMSEIVDRIERGEIPLRVTHNDTKINNVMLDKNSGEGLCVIDLDTVMPGSALYDYGDAVRFGASTAAEDEPDLGLISIDLGLFKAFTEGFVGAVRDSLTKTEIELLPLGIKVITCELAMRFLTDYIDGDLYFRPAYPGHNLVRARAQMKLLTEIEQRYDQMCEMIREML